MLCLWLIHPKIITLDQRRTAHLDRGLRGGGGGQAGDGGGVHRVVDDAREALVAAGAQLLQRQHRQHEVDVVLGVVCDREISQRDERDPDSTLVKCR